jgi:hypothetical protein
VRLSASHLLVGKWPMKNLVEEFLYAYLGQMASIDLYSRTKQLSDIGYV